MTERIFERFVALSEASPARPVLTFVGHQPQPFTTTAEALLEQTIRDRARLLDAGVHAHDVVFLALPDSPELVSLFIAATAIGAIPAVVQPRRDAAEFQARLRHAARLTHPVALIVDDNAWAWCESLAGTISVVRASDLGARSTIQVGARGRRPPVHPDIAFLQFSSGSTASQKAVAVGHRAVLELVTSRNAAYQLTPRDTLVGWVPLNHDLGLVGYVLTPLLSTTNAVLISTPHWLAHPAALMEVVSSVDSAICTSPNFGLGYCTSRIHDDAMSGLDLSRWRVLCCSAEPVRIATVEAFCERFARWGFRRDACASAYGLAENTLTATMTPPGITPRVDWLDATVVGREQFAQPVAAGSATSIPVVSCGVPLPGASVEIRDTRGLALPDRHVGEIFLRSPSVFTTYYGDEPLTDRVRRDGGLYTGDLGYLADGELFVYGRKSDTIVVGGLNVQCEDVEIIAGELAGVRPGRVVAFGVVDTSYGTESIIVVLEPLEDSPATPARLESDLRRGVSRALGLSLGRVTTVPKGWIVKTTSGKLARWRNREKWLQQFGRDVYRSVELHSRASPSGSRYDVTSDTGTVS